MSMIFGKPAEQQEELNHIEVTQSLQGLAVPIVFGTQRVPGLLVWYADFTATTHHPGGSAFGGKSTSIYTYTASWISLLCEGPIGGVNSIWDSGGQYLPQNVTTTFTIPAGTGGSQPTIPSSNFPNFATDTGVSKGGVPMERVFYDYMGGAAVPTLTTGQYAVDGSGNYTFSNADVGANITIYNTYYYSYRITKELHIVPGPPGPYSFIANQGGIAGDGNGIYQNDYGAQYYPSGTPLTRTSSDPPPVAGEYYVHESAGIGTYTFNSADANQEIVITYEYDDYQDDQYAPRTIGVTFFPGVLGQDVWSYLNTKHPDQAVYYSQSAYAAFENAYMGMSGVPPVDSYEIIGFDVIGGGILDCSPVDALYDMLTDPNIGIGYSSEYIDEASWYNNENSAQNWINALQLYMSDAILNQETVANVAGKYLEAFQIASFFSEGMLKLIPYGDQTAVGPLATYVPNTGIVAELTDDDFILPEDKADDPLTITRSPWTDAYNRTQINYLARINNYDQDLVYEQDEGSVERFGLRIESPVSYDFVTTVNVAAAVANMRLKRYVQVRNSQSFKGDWRLEYLEPMDLITITDTRMGIYGQVVRIIKTVNNPDGTIDFTCEDFPGNGYAMPFVNPKALTPPLHPVAGSAISGRTSAVVVEVTNNTPNRESTSLYIYCVGDSPDWGGCYVWISLDGTNFTALSNPVLQPARIGNLSSALAAIARDPSGAFDLTYDNVNAISVSFGNNSVNASTAGVPDWSNITIYTKGEQVVYDDQLWVALQQNQNSTPTISNPNWQLITSNEPAETPLASVTAADAQNLGTLSAIIELASGLTPSLVELLSYTDVAAGPVPNSYVLTDLYRGAYGTNVSAFSANAQFVRMDDASAVYQVPPGFAGTSVYIRFTAFNQKAGATQDLGNVDTFAIQIQPQGDAAVDYGPAVSSALNTQGSNNSFGDNATFSWSTTPTSVSFWWAAFPLYMLDGTQVNVAAQGSSGSPARTFSGLTASTTYYFAARYNLTTLNVEMMYGTAVLTPQQIIQWYNEDGYIPIFSNQAITTPASGSGGGGGGTGGGSCFTGDTRVKTIDGFKRFDELPETVRIVNETGVWTADLVVHEEASATVLAMSCGMVTEDHLIRYGREWKAIGEVYREVPRRVYSGRLYNLHVRTGEDKNRHFVLENGMICHNYKGGGGTL